MSIKHSRAAIANMIAGMGVDSEKKLHVVEASVIEGTEVTRIYGRLDKRNGKTLGAAEASAVIAKSLGGKVIPVADSFTVLSSSEGADFITGFVIPQHTSKPFNAEGLRAMAGNMFMDEEEHLWKLQKTEAGDILVRSHVDNADEIRVMMQSLCSNISVPELLERDEIVGQYTQSIQGISGGDDILYVDPETNKVTPAVVIASVEDVANTVAVANAEGGFTISRDLIVCAASFDGLEDDEAKQLEAQASGFTLEDITEYYRKVFQRRPEYFEQFMTRWRSHFSVA